MPKGPKGQYRPRDSFQSGIITMKIALGMMTEDDARKLEPKKATKARKTKAIKKTAKARKRSKHL